MWERGIEGGNVCQEEEEKELWASVVVGLERDCTGKLYIVRQQISFLCSEAFEPADQTQVSHSNGFLPLVLLQES